MKECRSCKVTKKNEEFTKRTSNLDGLYSYCKICTKEKNRITHAKRREAHKTKGKIYRELNKSSLCEKAKKYYYENKEALLKKRAEYREKNKDKISLREAEKRIGDPNRFEKNNEKHFTWREQNIEHVNEYQRKWYQKNKEKRRAHVVLNRAIKAGKIMRPENCSECSKKCKPDGHHEDYSKPLDVIWVCKSCHARKSPRTVIR